MATESLNGRIVSFRKKAAGRNTPFDAEAMKADNTIGKKITEAR